MQSMAVADEAKDMASLYTEIMEAIDVQVKRRDIASGGASAYTGRSVVGSVGLVLAHMLAEQPGLFEAVITMVMKKVMPAEAKNVGATTGPGRVRLLFSYGAEAFTACCRGLGKRNDDESIAALVTMLVSFNAQVAKLPAQQIVDMVASCVSDSSADSRTNTSAFRWQQ